MTEAEFERFVNANRDGLIRIARSTLRGAGLAHMAEDMVQTALVDLWHAGDTVRDPGGFANRALMGDCYDLIASAAATRGAEAGATREPVDPSPPEPPPALDWSAIEARLTPEEYRLVCRMFRDGLTREQLADEICRTPQAVSWRLIHRAYPRLRRLLAEYNPAGPPLPPTRRRPPTATTATPVKNRGRGSKSVAVAPDPQPKEEPAYV